MTSNNWLKGYRAYLKWRQTYPAYVLPEKRGQHAQLADWIRRQQKVRRNGGLRGERRERLEALDFPFENASTTVPSLYETFLQRVEQLAVFQAMRGHVDVPQTEEGMFEELGRWVDNTRRRFKTAPRDWRHQVISERIPEFSWELPTGRDGAQARWLRRVTELRRFQERHGFEALYPGHPENPTLADWFERQRAMHEKGSLDPLRVEVLRGYGFLKEHTDESLSLIHI